MKNKKTWIIALSVAAAFVVIYLITWAADLSSPPDDAASEVSNQTTVSDAATTAKQTEKENTDTTASSPSKLQTTTTEQITTTTKPITTTAEAAETTQKAHPKIVFWGHTGEKIHINPACHTIKNDVLSGSLDEAKAAGHNGWCGVCSKGWSDERFLEGGNPYAEN